MLSPPRFISLMNQLSYLCYSCKQRARFLFQLSMNLAASNWDAANRADPAQFAFQEQLMAVWSNTAWMIEREMVNLQNKTPTL